MSNNQAEIASAGHATDQVAGAQQTQPAPTFDALALHKEGAAMNASTAVAQNNIEPAVYRPGQTGGAQVEDVQYHGRGGYDRGGYPLGGAIAGALLYDTLVAPYNYNYPVAPYAYPQQNCYPSQYWGAPPVCYSTPVIPFYGPGYGDRGYGFGIPRGHENFPRPEFHRGR